MTELVESLNKKVSGWLDYEGLEVIRRAEEEARELGHDYVGTEHLALGVLRLPASKGARALGELHITFDRFRAQVVRIVGDGGEPLGGFTPGFTPRAKEVLALALREALSLGHDHIGSEHIMLGIVRENDGFAVRALLDLDVDAQKVRDEIIRQLGGKPPEPKEPPSS